MVFNDFVPKVKYDFDDILIEPQVISKITSRYNDITLPHMLPLITAPMDTVVDLNNINVFLENNIHVALPRTIKYQDFKNFYFKNKSNKNIFTNTFIGFGLENLNIFIENEFNNFHENGNLLIDVANGHMEKIVEYCYRIKKLRPDIKIMVGNIANPETYRLYADSKLVDYIRIGIGNGGGCLTTKQSGVGYPMASLIHETYMIKEEIGIENNLKKNELPAIVADGGMKDYADIVKALALGADFVMLGSIFNKALESCAPNYYRGRKIDIKKAKKLFLKGKKVEKYFRGMSTKGAQKAMGKKVIKTSEGIERIRPVEYTLKKWIENFEHYLRNAMSYSNAKELKDFIGNVPICQITTRAYDRFNK